MPRREVVGEIVDLVALFLAGLAVRGIHAARRRLHLA